MRKGPFELISSRPVYRNAWVHLREDLIKRPSGAPGLFAVVDLKAGSTVLPMDSEGNVYLVREYKYAVNEVTLEAISGGIEPSELPIEAAKRELREETGIEAGEWIDLGMVNPFTSAILCPNYMFLARDLRHGLHERDDGEVIDVVKAPLGEALDMVISGAITHAASCVAILKAARGNLAGR